MLRTTLCTVKDANKIEELCVKRDAEIKAGRVAYLAGDSARENPHAHGTDWAYFWDKGWSREARKEASND